MSDRLRRARQPAAILLALASVAAMFWWVVAAQSAKQFHDSTAYIEAASQPWSVAQLFYPKPMFVSLVYRWIGTDAQTIARFQEWLAFVSWMSFGVVVVCAMRTWSARIAGGVVAVFLLLAPLRMGYADAVLSESINDSLMALGLALAVALCTLPARVADLRRRRRVAGALAIGLIGVLAMWLFARDTNAVIALCGVAVVNAVWIAAPGGDARRVRPWRIAGSVVVAALAVLVLWSSSVVPPPTGFTVQRGWAPELTARRSYSALNNIVDIVLPDPVVRAYFVERGLPQATELATASRGAILTEPRYVEARRWIADRGHSVYLRWLLSRPLARLRDQVTYPWVFLGVSREQTYAMPDRGWVGRRPVLRRVLDLASRKGVLLALIAMFPLIAVRLRRDPRVQLAACLVVTGWIGSQAAFHADTAEPARHCFGSGQQVICGLFLAALAGFDAWRCARQR